MTKEELIEFLKENLSIWIDSDDKTVYVKLSLLGEDISIDSTRLYDVADRNHTHDY